MKYMGSKSKIAKDIVPIIQRKISENGITRYLEPFVGGANVIDKIQCEHKYASDKQKYLIALYQNLDKIESMPVFITKEHYSEVRDCYNKSLNTFEDWYIGAVGFLASYNGRFFDGGYAGLVKTKIGTERNYYDEARRNLIKQIPNLADVKFHYCDYRSIKPTTKNFLIYCDPPYKDTKQYGSSKNFDHDEFWGWVRQMSVNNIVVVSEQQAPDDFECIWEEASKRTINHAATKKSIERLFELRR